MLGTIMADYTEDRSRGIGVAVSGVLNALGVITRQRWASGACRSSSWNRGASQEAAGHDAHFVVGGLVLPVRPGLAARA